MQALALIGAGLVASTAIVSPADAQDYTTGAVSGTVVGTDGKTVANAQVTLRSQAQNQTRTLTTSDNGRFSASGLTPGTYDVTIHSEGSRDETDTLSVVAARESSVTFTLVGANAPADIVVTGTRVRQDFTQTTTGLNLNVVDTLKNAPVGRTLSSLIQLAPTTIPGAAGFGTGNNQVESIGGSSVAETAYYINGLNITNPDTYVGSSRVPFDFYQTVDVQTGGYAAEFGRATGGVINATSKSGSNAPMMAIHGNFLPDVRSHPRNTGNPELPDTIGNLSKDYNDSLTIEASGALIKDHVFLYGLFQPQSLITEAAYPTLGYLERTKSQTPFYGGKADVYIIPTQHLEFTIFNTSAKTYRDRYAITPNANFTNAEIGDLTGSEVQHTGGLNWVGRYTGSITDWFQISGAYGISKDSGDLAPADTAAYYVEDQRQATTGGNVTNISAQKFSGQTIDDTKRRFYRVDGDLRFALLGDHHIRGGMDNEDLSETKITQLNGAAAPVLYSYRDVGVRVTYERLGGHVSGRDRAFYLQDSWKPINGLTLNLGVRDDEFNQRNLSGQKYLDFKGNWAARAGFSYTPNGNSPFKVFGNYGRYFIPPAMNLGFRGKDDYFREYFSYGAYTAATFPVDPVTGLPLADFGPALTNIGGYSSPCPNDLSGIPGHPQNGAATCVLFGSNLQDPAYAKIARGAKATYEDEFIIGGRVQPTGLLSVGLTGTYRKLKRVSEDTDFSQQLLDYYGCDGQNGNNPQTGTDAQCARYALRNTYYIWNPGKSATLVDWVDPTKVVSLTNLDFPKPKRTYKAVVLDFRRADDQVWNAEGSITWSKSKGNYEGTVSSDVGNGVQADAGSTVDYDYPGLAKYTYGLLPNDHRWVFKLAGGFHLTESLYFGANVQAYSPMHGSCEGFNPVDPDAAGYESISFYCGTGPLDADGNYTQSQPAPRGTGWKTTWYKQIDLAVRYTLPESIGLNGLTLRADVFNVFNFHSITNRNPEHEIDSDGSTYFTPNPAYRTPTAYQLPRYFRFGFDWVF